MSSPSTLPADRLIALTKLAKRWPRLNDLTRAEKLASNVQAGVSRRQLARVLGISESMIRYLLKLMDATQEERRCLRKGKARTKQVVRQIELRRTQRAAEHPDREAERRDKEPEEIAGLILQLLDAEKFASPYALRIVWQAEFVLLNIAPEEGEELRRLDPAPTIPPPFERPRAEKMENASEEVEGFATMLARWLIRGWSSPYFWFDALAVAVRELEKRVPLFVQPTPMACEPYSGRSQRPTGALRPRSLPRVREESTSAPGRSTTISTPSVS